MEMLMQNQPEEALKNYVKAAETNKNDLLPFVEQGKQLWQKKKMLLKYHHYIL
jgi:hypothetical protein